MPTAEERVRVINEERMKVWSRCQEITANAERDGGMLAEDKANFDAGLKRIDEIDMLREAILSSDTAKHEVETVNEELRRVTTPDERKQMERRDEQANDEIRSLFRRPGDDFTNIRQVDGMDIDLSVPAAYFQALRAGMPFSELRTYATDTGTTGGSLTVPTTVANTIYAFLVNSNSIRRISKVITTSGGNPMNFPRVTTHSVGTQIANQSTAVTAGTAVLGAMTLSAYDFGQLSSVSNDMLEDSAVDVIGFVSEQIGRSLGIATGTAYAVGTGSGVPTGVITVAPLGAAGTVATGGTTLAGVNAISGIVDPFIDLQYSIADGYRAMNPAFVVHNTTAGVLRKARETGGTAGAYLWQPSPTVGVIPGQPDRFLGDAIYSDANIASIASNSKIAVYGDWSAFIIRDVAGLRLERSNDLYFNLNQVAFRGILRTDSNLLDTKALNILKMSV